MASKLQNLSTYDETKLPDASEMSFGIVVSEWHSHITHAIYEACVEILRKQGVRSENMHTMQVPGSFELPVAARMMNQRHNPDAVICIGCLIRGETSHSDYISLAVANGLINLGIASGKPYIFGVLTCDTEEQALDRAGGKHGNKGVESAVTAIRMAALRHEGKDGRKTIGFVG